MGAIKTMIEEQQVVRITERAVREITRLIDDEGCSEVGLRLGVKGGGCSGLSYVIDFGEIRENDNISNDHGFPVFVDPKSSLYLKDVVLDFSGGLSDRGFKFVNPNAVSTCGCGESFSV